MESSVTSPIATIKDRQDGADRRLGLACPSRGLGWLVQPPRRRVVQRPGCGVRARGLLRLNVLRRRQRFGGALRNVHRRRGQHEPPRASRSSTTRPRRLSRPPSIGLRTAKGWYRKPVTVSFAGHRRDVRDRGLHCADALRRPGSVESSGRRVVPRRGRKLGRGRPERSSTTRRPRRSRRRRPRSTRVSRASAGSAPATWSKSNSSVAPGSTARSRRSSTEATALRSSTRQ